MSKIIAHRGFYSLAPENSLQAVKKALEYNYINGVEIDVRMTKDDKFVLIHNKAINQVSNGKGEVKDLTLNELLKYDYSANKLDKRLNLVKSFLSNGGKHIRVRIKQYSKDVVKLSLLEDILKTFDKRKILLLHLKLEKGDYQKYADELYNILIKHKNKNIYIESYNISLLEALKEKNIPFKLGILIGNYRQSYKLLLPYDFYSIKYTLLRYPRIRDLVKMTSKEIMVWTMNTSNQYNRMHRRIGDKISNIYVITNYPDIINQVNKKEV